MAKDNITDFADFQSFLRSTIIRNFKDAKLLEWSKIDPLLKISTQAYYNEYLEGAIGKTFTNTGVAVIDANNLKYINDNYGHEEVDKLLITIASSLRNNFRHNNIFRRGGDEFVIICPDIPEELFQKKLSQSEQDWEQAGYSACWGATYSFQPTALQSLITTADLLEKQEKDIYHGRARTLTK